MWRLLMVCLLVGCAPATVRLRATHLDLAGGRASWRDFPAGAICDAEPRFLLDELSSVNGVLSRYLRLVPDSTADDAAWTDEVLALVDEGDARLAPLLDAHHRNLADLGRCSFSTQGAWPSLRARGAELLTAVRARLTLSATQAREVRQARELAAWRETRLRQQDEARRACPVRLGAAIVSFAWRENGATTWVFCDGAQVMRAPEGGWSLEPAPLEFTRGRRPADATYFAAARRYPEGAIVAPPSSASLSAW